MNPSESQQNLLTNEAKPGSTSQQSLTPPADYVLGPVEKHFLLSAERGDCATVRRLLEENKDHPELLNIDCVDPLNRSALIAAIENENIDLILLLLELGIAVKVCAYMHTKSARSPTSALALDSLVVLYIILSGSTLFFHYVFIIVWQDSLLHAIKEEYVEGVEILLEHEEKIHQPGQPYVSRQKFTHCILYS